MDNFAIRLAAYLAVEDKLRKPAKPSKANPLQDLDKLVVDMYIVQAVVKE